jgi:hypothetical protein
MFYRGQSLPVVSAWVSGLFVIMRYAPVDPAISTERKKRLKEQGRNVIKPQEVGGGKG